MLYIPKLILSPCESLVTCALKIRYKYCLYGSVFEPCWKQAHYQQAVSDWPTWLRLAEDLLSNLVAPGEFMEVARDVDERDSYPLLDDLFSEQYKDKYKKWLSEQSGPGTKVGFFFRYQLFQIIEKMRWFFLELEEYDLDPPEDRHDQLVLGFFERDSILCGGERTTNSLEAYIIAHRLKIQEDVCDASMFCNAVLQYFPLREIYRGKNFVDLASFWNAFDPIAEDWYLNINDFSGIDFDAAAQTLMEKAQAKPVKCTPFIDMMPHPFIR